MKFFFDTEFLENGRTIELISIGIAAEDGREYYAVNEDARLGWVISNPWLVENVVPYLPLEKIDHTQPWSRTNYRKKIDDPAWRTRFGIAADIIKFVGESPEFWAYYADYDWVALCQLYGRMIDLPGGWPMWCRDLKQLSDTFDIPVPKQIGQEHHALADAMWVKRGFNHIRSKLSVGNRIPRGLYA